MALVACKDCNKEVSAKATTCPSCGARLKMATWLKVILWIVGGYFGLILMIAITTAITISNAAN